MSTAEGLNITIIIILLTFYRQTLIRLFSDLNVINMPIFKYKTFEEAKRSLWKFHPDEAYIKNAAELQEFANKHDPINYPKGIFKFKSLEAANKQREEFELENALKKRKTLRKF